MQKIALIGLSTIEHIAVRSILDGIESVGIVTYGAMSEFYEREVSADKYILTADVFSNNPEFFLPKKGKILILCEGKEVKDDGLFCVGRDSDLMEIQTAFENFMNIKSNNDLSSSDLSQREREVLKELANGLTMKEIADKLNITTNTAVSHRKNISAKLGIRSVSGLSVYAIMNGII